MKDVAYFRRRRALRAIDELLRLAEEQEDILQPLSTRNLEVVRNKLTLV